MCRLHVVARLAGRVLPHARHAEKIGALNLSINGMPWICHIPYMNIADLDLNLLPAFDALMRHASVSAAARELGMSQPAMSHALARLRVGLGDPLFVRSGRGLSPTVRAEALARPVRDILDRLHGDVLGGGAFDPASSRRRFTLCLSDVGSFVLWPRIVAAVAERAPGVSLALTSLDASRIGGALEQGGLDLAIGAYPELPASLYQQRLFERAYVCLVREGHPFTVRPPDPAAFAAARHVAVEAPSRTSRGIDTLLAALGLSRRVALRVPSYLMLPPLIESGDWVAVVPGQLAEAFRGRGLLASAPVPLALPAVTIRQHWHARMHVDAGNAWLRGVVAGLFAESATGAQTRPRRGSGRREPAGRTQKR
jgi:DNA-binding transcriptional LysR family regulator